MNLHSLEPTQIAVIVFAIFFVGVGIYRVIEFNGIGLSSTKRRVLIAMHIFGALFFGSAIITQALSFTVVRRDLSFGLFISALLFLAPGQFTIGMIRKRVIEKEMAAQGRVMVQRKPLISKLMKVFKK